MNQRIMLNERASLNRPAWSSESSTGNFEAHKHLHISRRDYPAGIVEDYYTKSKGKV